MRVDNINNIKSNLFKATPETAEYKAYAIKLEAAVSASKSSPAARADQLFSWQSERQRHWEKCEKRLKRIAFLSQRIPQLEAQVARDTRSALLAAEQEEEDLAIAEKEAELGALMKQKKRRRESVMDIRKGVEPKDDVKGDEDGDMQMEGLPNQRRRPSVAVKRPDIVAVQAKLMDARNALFAQVVRERAEVAAKAASYAAEDALQLANRQAAEAKRLEEEKAAEHARATKQREQEYARRQAALKVAQAAFAEADRWRQQQQSEQQLAAQMEEAKRLAHLAGEQAAAAARSQAERVAEIKLAAQALLPPPPPKSPASSAASTKASTAAPSPSNSRPPSPRSKSRRNSLPPSETSSAPPGHIIPLGRQQPIVT